MAAEADHPAQPLADEIAAVGLLVEIAATRRRRQGSHRPLAVPAERSGGQRGTRDIRSQHVDRGIYQGERLVSEQRQSVGLFPARTPRAPGMVRDPPARAA